MPIYEYRCASCGAELEKLQKISDPPLVECPECGKDALVKLVSASSFRLKGSGWYETDFKTGKKKNGAAEASGDAAASADAAGGGSSATAPATSSAPDSGGKDVQGKEQKGGEQKAGEQKKAETKSSASASATAGSKSKPETKA